MNELRTFVMLGTGNLAGHLTDVLVKNNIELIQVYNRTEESAVLFSQKFNCAHTSDLDLLNTEADLYILALSDYALVEVADAFPFTHKPIVHCSGSTSIDLFKDRFSEYGVFYPFQTFSKGVAVDFKSIPVCVEADSDKLLQMLESLAHKISDAVYRIDSNGRKALHLSAVFACNFANYMYSVAEDLLNKHQIPFELLYPLIKATAEKAIVTSPGSVQTGPARRNDQITVNEHLQLLSDAPQWQQIYKLCSECIINKYHPDLTNSFDQ